MITEQDYIRAAETLSCEVAVIKTVDQVESHGTGFLSTGEVVILFEPHIFWRQLQRARVRPEILLKEKPGYSDILYEFWQPGKYGPLSTQWDRLRKAAEINLVAAYKSASFGRFQIMGFNHEKCGYKTVIEFAKMMERDEVYHLKSFVCLLKQTGIDKYLAAKNWKAFAREYNGPGYKGSPATILDDYDYKLIEAYKKLSL